MALSVMSSLTMGLAMLALGRYPRSFAAHSMLEEATA